MEYMQAGDPSGSCHTILPCLLSQFDQHQRKSPIQKVSWEKLLEINVRRLLQCSKEESDEIARITS